MLRGKMVVLLMIRRGEMAERRVLMETGRHHGCNWWESRTLVRLHHEFFGRKQSLGLMAADGSRTFWSLSRNSSEWWQKEARSGTTLEDW